jgi:hypothetical protein
MMQADESTASRDLREALKDGKAPLSSETHVFVSAFGGARKPQHSIAPAQEPICDGVEDFVVDGIAGPGRSRFAEQRKSEPFANQRDVSRTVEREGDGLKRTQILFHQRRIVTGSRAVRTGNQDHEGCGGHQLRGLSCEGFLKLDYRAISCNVNYYRA